MDEITTIIINAVQWWMKRTGEYPTKIKIHPKYFNEINKYFNEINVLSCDWKATTKQGFTEFKIVGMDVEVNLQIDGIEIS